MIHFIEARKVFLDNFPQQAPPPTLLQQIAQQLGITTIVNSFQDFNNGIKNLNQAISQDSRTLVQRMGLNKELVALCPHSIKP
jgi:hypothetical protein